MLFLFSLMEIYLGILSFDSLYTRIRVYCIVVVLCLRSLLTNGNGKLEESKRIIVILTEHMCMLASFDVDKIIVFKWLTTKHAKSLSSKRVSCDIEEENKMVLLSLSHCP